MVEGLFLAAAKHALLVALERLRLGIVLSATAPVATVGANASHQNVSFRGLPGDPEQVVDSLPFAIFVPSRALDRNREEHDRPCCSFVAASLRINRQAR